MGAFRVRERLWVGIGGLLLLLGCNGNRPSAPSPAQVSLPPLASDRPAFSADSAYSSLEKIMAFGPRIPGTASHKACGDWLVAELSRHGAKVYEQKGRYKGTPVRNIVASFGPDTAGGRVILSAHWDSRPWAERDPENPQAPVPGANDGASGVAVLLELARLFAEKPLPYPVDIILWDSEDLGRENEPDSYCLGSQYWVSRPEPYPTSAYAWGINLDMVGGRNATFLQEAHSRQYAPTLTATLWQVARQLGYERLFLSLPGDPITDDPYYLSSQARIPMTNIIQRDPAGRGFFPEWHTTRDNLAVIDRATLQAVGQTLVAFLYTYRPEELRAL